MLFPYPDISNLLTRWDERHESILGVIKALLEIDIKKIAIKIKEGNNGNDVNTLIKILNNNSLSKVEILTGPLAECINLTKIIIGPLGSSVVEASYNNIPYYVYEPNSNGLTNEELYKSIANKALCSRSVDDLMDNICNKRYLAINKRKIVDAPFMSDINFDCLVK